MRLTRSKLSTQIGVTFFLGMALSASAMIWQVYREDVRRIPAQIEYECQEHANLIALAIADNVVYRKPYPIWSMLSNLVEEADEDPVFRLQSFTVVNESGEVMADSDPLHHPLSMLFALPESGVSWEGRMLKVVRPIHQPSSNRQVGRVLLRYYAVAIDQQLELEKVRLAVLLGFSLLFALLVSFGMSMMVARPLRELASAARKIGSGSAIDVGMHEQRAAEVRDLAQSIAAADKAVDEGNRQIDLLASVLSQADEMVVLTDTEGYITYVNPAFERCTGYTAAEVIGHTPKIVKSGEHDAEYYAEMWLAITSGKVWRDGFKNRRKDGSIYQVSQSIFPVVDASGAVIAYAAVQQDVTERKRMEEKLRHTDRVESLGVLAGGIAHDFNNLLTSILGHASLAKEKSDTSSPVWHHLERIEQASLSSADLCRQMLAYSGKGKFVVQPVDLSRLIETMGKLVEVSVSKKIGIRYMLSDQLPLIEADVAQMQQVVLNLLTNASEAIGEQYGSITVSTGQLAVDTDYLEECLGHEHIQAGDFVYLEVIDSGCGMSRETQGKIFDPFFTTKMTGRGLGMSAMLGIVRGHRGVLRISSESGQGTSIRVLIPATGEQSRVVAAELPEDIPMKSGTVLVIDDEEVVREIAQTMLEGMGYGVLKACDGMEGLEQFEEFKERISFVLLDMTMPKMSGLECFAELRRLDPDVRVILSSGYTEQEVTSSFVGKGLAGFLQKPYRARQLASVIDAMHTDQAGGETEL